MALTPDDIRVKTFTITKFRDGFDQDEVDDFLDIIANEISQHETEKAQLQAKIDELSAQIAAADAPVVDPAQETIVVDAAPAAPSGANHDAIKSSAMLQMALELHDKYVSEGETTRDKLISEAEIKSAQTIEDATRTAHELVTDAQRRRSEDLEAHSKEMKTLKGEVDNLRSFESEYRSTLRSYIQSQLRDLESSPEPQDRPGGLD